MGLHFPERVAFRCRRVAMPALPGVQTSKASRQEAAGGHRRPGQLGIKNETGDLLLRYWYMSHMLRRSHDISCYVGWLYVEIIVVLISDEYIEFAWICHSCLHVLQIEGQPIRGIPLQLLPQTVDPRSAGHILQSASQAQRSQAARLRTMEHDQAIPNRSKHPIWWITGLHNRAWRR